MKLHFPEHFEPREPSERLEILEQPLLVRLTADVGKLPAGFVYQLCRDEATRLIMQRKATAVGSLAAVPDLVISEDDFALATA